MPRVAGARATSRSRQFLKVKEERALVAKIGWAGVLEREHQRFADWYAAHPELQPRVLTVEDEEED